MVNKEYLGYGTAPSKIRELFAYGLAQKAKGEEVYDYSIGNPSIPAPPKVNESIEDLAKNMDSIALHGYSMGSGHVEPREAVAADLNERYGTDIKAENLFFTCGAAPALVSVLRALTVDENSEIIAIAPFFPEYTVFAQSAGAQFKVVPADIPDFQVDLAELEKTITKNTQAIIVNSPNNPSGVVFSKETLEKMADILNKKAEEYGHPIYIVADEPYRELVYGGVEVTFIPTVYKNTIVCYSYSKSLSLPGERLGYVCVPDQVEDSKNVYAAMAGAARTLGHVCAPTLQQFVIGRCATERPNLAAYDENRNLIYNSLTEMGYTCAKPDGAFYLFVEAPNGDAGEFSEKAKNEHNLLVVPGDGFGCKSYFRLSYCVANDMIKASLPAFKAMIESYK